jgi:hypothetical protein
MDAKEAGPDEAILVRGRHVRIARLEDEMDRDLTDPQGVIERLRRDKRVSADIFTFIQRIPDTEPRYGYVKEWDSCAALEYGNFTNWFEKIIDAQCRNKIRKSAKKGLAIKQVEFNDTLVRGIEEIYNESPTRQGKRFWHYKKPFVEVKAANASHLDKSVFIGAYLGEELIGFVKLVCGSRIARTEQIIAKLAHRDKAPTNALLAKSVEICEAKGIPFLVYGTWSSGPLGDFKKSNGFVRYDFPRYFVPLNFKGRLATTLGIHRGLKNIVPQGLRERLVSFRRKWNDSRSAAR